MIIIIINQQFKSFKYLKFWEASSLRKNVMSLPYCTEREMVVSLLNYWSYYQKLKAQIPYRKILFHSFNK